MSKKKGRRVTKKSLEEFTTGIVSVCFLLIDDLASNLLTFWALLLEMEIASVRQLVLVSLFLALFLFTFSLLLVFLQVFFYIRLTITYYMKKEQITSDTAGRMLCHNNPAAYT